MNSKVEEKPNIEEKPEALWTRIRFRLGIFLLVVNMPLGYLCLPLGVYVGHNIGKKGGVVVGVVCYALTWLMMGLGVYLAGPRGVHLTRYYWKVFCKKLLQVVFRRK